MKTKLTMNTKLKVLEPKSKTREMKVLEPKSKTREKVIEEIKEIIGKTHKPCSVDDFRNGACWRLLSEWDLSQEFICFFQDDIHWDKLVMSDNFQNLSYPFLHSMRHKIPWDFLAENRQLSLEFIIEFKSELDGSWYYISKYQDVVVDEKFLKKFANKVFWLEVSKRTELTLEMMEKFIDRLDMVCLLSRHTIPEEFIRKYIKKMDYVAWNHISRWYNLSEIFIRDFHEYLDWDMMSIQQNISESLLIDFHNKFEGPYALPRVLRRHKYSKKITDHFNKWHLQH